MRKNMPIEVIFFRRGGGDADPYADLFHKSFQGHPCCILFGALFAGAGAGADGVSVEQDLHPEPFGVVRALLAHQGRVRIMTEFRPTWIKGFN